MNGSSENHESTTNNQQGIEDQESPIKNQTGGGDMSWRLLKGFLVLWCIFVPGIAAAQSAIAGVARDSSGAVLPGVSVEVSSPALIEKVRSTITDAAGQYRVVD